MKTMKKIILIIALTAFNNVLLFSQSFDWIKKEGGADSRDMARKSMFDASGNLYVIGTFGGLNGGTTSIGSNTLTSFGRTDMFLAKYNSNRDLIWIRQAGSTLYEYVYGLEIDGGGNVYISGIFGKSIGNGNAPMMFGDVTLNSFGKADLFTAKYNSAGDLIWAKSYGSVGDDQLNAMSMDAAGNLYITGGYSNTITFGSVTLPGNEGYYRTFICKINADGNIIWVRNADGTSLSIGVDIESDASGNTVTTGFFQGNMKLENIVRTSAGASDLFLSKYDTEGNLLWFKRAGGSQFDYGLAVDISNDGSIALTGTFEGISDFGNGFIITADGGGDLFVNKYDTDGNTLWVRTAFTAAPPGFSGSVAPSDAIFDSQGNIYLTGYFAGNIIFGGFILNRSAEGLCDAYVIRYDQDGNFILSKQIFSGGTEYPSYTFTHTLTRDAIDNIYVNGSFLGRARFDFQTIDAEEDLDDFFIARILFTPTGINPVSTELPDKFNLSQNYPNPFNPKTVINYNLASNVNSTLSNVKLVVYDIQGRQIATLVNEQQVAGEHSVVFDASNISSGVYYYKLESGEFTDTKKMLLIK